MDGIQILKDENNFPICSGYKCDKIINSKYQNDILHNSCVPFGLVVFPHSQHPDNDNDNIDVFQIDELDIVDVNVQNKLLDKLLKSKCSFKISNKTNCNRSKVKIQKTRKLKR